MKNFIRIILAILLTPAYALADENVKPTKPEEKEAEEVVEAKENDEAEVEETVESESSDGIVDIPLTAGKYCKCSCMGIRIWNSSRSYRVR